MVLFADWPASGLQGGQYLIEHLLGIAKQHAVVVLVEQRVVHPGVAAGHAALHDDTGLGLPYFQHRHASDGAVGVFGGAGVDDAVGADDDDHVGLGEVVVDLIHLHDDVVGHLGFGQQHVHVPRHATGDGVDSKLHLHTLVAQGLGD